MQNPELTQYHDDDHVPPKTAARFTGCSTAHLGNLRWLNRGPAYTRVGTAIRYRVGDLLEYMQRRRIVPEGD